LAEPRTDRATPLGRHEARRRQLRASQNGTYAISHEGIAARYGTRVLLGSARLRRWDPARNVSACLRLVPSAAMARRGVSADVLRRRFGTAHPSESQEKITSRS